MQVTGRDCHTGTTDFANRSDALLASAKMILHSHKVAVAYGVLASTGILTLTPGSTNTVPGNVRFSLDIRATEDDVVMRCAEQLKLDFEKIAKNAAVGNLNEGVALGNDCQINWTLDFSSGAIKFDESCIRCIKESSKELFGNLCGDLTQEMTSGAGHDSVSHKFPKGLRR